MFLTLPLLLELLETLQHPKFAQRLAARGETPEAIIARFRAACHEAVPVSITPPAQLRDPVHILACTVAAGADLIVTGDKDLLSLSSFENIPIVRAAEALIRLGLS